MSDLKLLPPDQPTRFERLLLDAASNEAPSTAQRERVRQALGLPAPLAVAPVAAAGSRVVLLKASLAGLAAAALVGGWLWSRSTRPDTVSTQAVRAVAPVVRNQESAAPAVSAAALPAEALTANSPANAAVTAPQPGAPRRAPALETGADLSEQLRLIESARAALASGNASAAAAALASYGSRFPRGSFAQEASVLRIETLELQGHRAQAAAQARSFLARHPNSPHVALVERIAKRAP